jgi:hypothetical protein
MRRLRRMGLERVNGCLAVEMGFSEPDGVHHEDKASKQFSNRCSRISLFSLSCTNRLIKLLNAIRPSFNSPKYYINPSAHPSQPPHNCPLLPSQY